MELKTTKVKKIKVEQIKILKHNSVLHFTKAQDDGTYLVKYTEYNMMPYNKLVNLLVKERYSDSEEFNLINDGIADSNNAKYKEYRSYVEECKARAKAFIEERNKALEG